MKKTTYIIAAFFLLLLILSFLSPLILFQSTPPV